MAVACLHLIQILGVQNFCCERFHLVAIDQLIVGLLVTSHSCIRWKLFNIEVLLAVFWHN